jgi:hypothetical protein
MIQVFFWQAPFIMEYLFRNMRGIGLLRLCNFLLFLGLWPLVRIQGKKKAKDTKKNNIYLFQIVIIWRSIRPCHYNTHLE